jgi:prevent-host-death family protein
VKTVELSAANASLSDYARHVREETVVVTRRGRPVAALMAVGPHTDLENLRVTTDPRFMAMIERSRRLCPPGTGLTTEELREQLRIPRRKAKRKAG